MSLILFLLVCAIGFKLFGLIGFLFLLVAILIVNAIVN